MKFPIFKTKTVSSLKFDLNNPKEREKYFNLKAGREIKKLREFFKKGNTFVAYLLGKKNSGKGTYSKMFSEIIDPETIDHFSIGDMIREIDKELKDKKRKKEFIEFLEKNYRGWFSVKELISVLEKRNTKILLPTELILALVKREIGKRKKKTIFIDGFPRDLDQINFALFFRDLIGYRDDSDFFVLIDVPERVIDERIKYRVVCPVCQTSRNLKLFPTSKIGYDAKRKEFYLLCDNPKCEESKLSSYPTELPKEAKVRKRVKSSFDFAGARECKEGEENKLSSSPFAKAREIKMIRKEGDEAGIKSIKERLKKDEKLINQALSLYGIPKVLLRNSVPKKLAANFVDDYEITPEYYYQWNEKEKKVIVKEKPWIVLDDAGESSHSLLPPPIVISLIKQIADILNL